MIVYFTPLNLSSGSGEKLLHSVASLASPELAALAERLRRLFSIASPFAPGFHCLGGEIAIDSELIADSDKTRLSVAGNGETLTAALVSCLGEAAEFLSQLERPGDIEADAAAGGPTNFVADGWIAAVLPRPGRTIDWIKATGASTGGIALLPADLCLRRSPTRRAIEPVAALSCGVAAGATREAAALHAILELCERNAAAMWWLGGCRPKRFAPDHPATIAAAALIDRLRQGETTRRTVLLDITTDNDVPVVAAVSVDRNGRGMACGVSSKLSASDAAKAALLEMCQMEMAAPIAETKRAERGDAALNEADRRHLRRADFAASKCELLIPRDISPHNEDGPAAISGLDALTDHLRNRGVRLFLLDHTRQDIGINVMRAVSPDLQPFSTAVSTKRFSDTVRENQDFFKNQGSTIAERDVPLL